MSRSCGSLLGPAERERDRERKVKELVTQEKINIQAFTECASLLHTVKSKRHKSGTMFL
jgi:hypothetical protein